MGTVQTLCGDAPLVHDEDAVGMTLRRIQVMDRDKGAAILADQFGA